MRFSLKTNIRTLYIALVVLLLFVCNEAYSQNLEKQPTYKENGSFQLAIIVNGVAKILTIKNGIKYRFQAAGRIRGFMDIMDMLGIEHTFGLKITFQQCHCI